MVLSESPEVAFLACPTISSPVFVRTWFYLAPNVPTMCCNNRLPSVRKLLIASRAQQSHTMVCSPSEVLDNVEARELPLWGRIFPFNSPVPCFGDDSRFRTKQERVVVHCISAFITRVLGVLNLTSICLGFG